MLLKDKDKREPQKKSSILSKEGSEAESHEEPEPEMLKYTLEKLLAQSAEREEGYVSFIKEQKEQIHMLTEKYADLMGAYKKEMKNLIEKGEKDKIARNYEGVHKMPTKVPPNKYRKQEYSTTSEYELQCTINFLYINPVLEDYVKQEFPSKFTILVFQHYPLACQKEIEAQLNPELSEQELIERYENGYTIELYSPNMLEVSYNFVLSHFSDRAEPFKVIKYFKQSQLQIMIKNDESQLVFGSAKIDLEQFLQFNPESEEEWIEKIPIMSVDGSESIIAFLHTNMFNKAVPKTISKQHIHKLSQPIFLAKNEIKVNNDKERRQLQRINQYKNSHHSLVPSLEVAPDKSILLHQKKKELEQIEQYKEAKKSEYMEKVFEEAIEQYNTENIEIGECKYLFFPYTNHSDRNQRVKPKIYHKLHQQEGSKFEQSLIVEMIEPNLSLNLIKQGIIEVPSKIDNCSIDFSLENNEVFVSSGESIAIFVKVIYQSMFPNSRIEVSISFSNDFGESLHNETVYLRTWDPIPAYIFPMYCYVQETAELKIQIPTIQMSESSLMGKAKALNILGNLNICHFGNRWSNGNEILELKIEVLPKAEAGTHYTFYIFVYDVNYCHRIAGYQFNILCLDKMEQQSVEMGVAYMHHYKLRIPPVEGQKNTKVALKLGSSDYLGGHISVEGQTSKNNELSVERNSEFAITIKHQTYSEHPNQDKVVFTCVDLLTKKILKAIAMPILKSPSSYKHVYKLTVEAGKPYTFTYEVSSPYREQNTFKLYSSNYSMMTISQETVVLFGKQVKPVELEFNYWNKEGNEKNERQVILSIDDGKQVLLYLFELLAEEA